MGKPRDFAPVLNGVMWFQVALASIFISLRLYTRRYIVQKVGADDYLMLVNLATMIGFVICVSVGTTHGVGKKTVDVVSLGLDYSKAIMWEAIGQGICIMGIAASKGAVAIFLLRIVLKKWHIALLWFCIVSTTILCIITTTLLYTQCRPAAFLWDHSIKDGVCWLNFTPVGLTMGAWSAAMDFVLALLPWHVIMGLNMKQKEKYTIAIGLSLGVLAGTCSIIRTIELQSLSSFENYVYDTSSMLIWSSSEVCLTIICACIPVLRPLYVRIRHGSRGDSSNPRTYGLREYGASKHGDVTQSGSARSKVYMGPASILQTKVGSDNASEETILRSSSDHKTATPSLHHGWEAETGITMTRDIRITTAVADKQDV